MGFPGSLHNHTEYSNIRLKDCIIKLPDLIDTAVQLGHEVVAITDHDCISSHIKALEYYQEIKKDNPDFKLILGNEIYLCRGGMDNENFIKGEGSHFHFVLLAKDEIGHRQIREISSRAWRRSYVSRGIKRVPTYYSDLIEIIDKDKGHIIGLTACLGGFIGQKILQLSKEYEEELDIRIQKWLLSMVRLFGPDNFYLELQPPAKKNNEQYIVNQKILEYSKSLNIPWVITTDSHYAVAADREIHKIYLNSQNGEREVDSFYGTTYLMTTEEIENYFDYDLSEAYGNIQKIKNMCQDYDLRKPLKIPQLLWKEFHPISNPLDWKDKIPMIEKFITSDYIGDRELAKAIIEKLESDERLRNKEHYEAIEDNLDKVWESSIVNNAHWSAYFLNLQKIIDCCWEAGSLVMPARGSGASFVLLYLLDIIQINPVWEKAKMYSWRFLNPSRVSVLDIDFDTEGNKRDIILNKFREIYGNNRVCNVATFGLEKSKSAILSAARGLNIDVEIAQYISSLIPSDRGVTRTLSQCYYGDEDQGFKPINSFIEAMNDYPDLWRVASKIENLVCRLGSHAGGVVFTDEDITNTAALMATPDGLEISCYELHDLEKVSMIKFDVLSIEAADKIHKCLDLLIEAGYVKPEKTLKETYEKVIGVYNLDRVSSKMWQLVNDHKIQSLFQMEQQSGIQGIELTHPQSVEDLAHLNSIIRLMPPDKNSETPLQKYARFKKNIGLWYQEMTNWGLTPKEQRILEPYLLESYGICENQETIMKLVQIPECGGYDLNFSDKLRKAVAKKNGKDFDTLEKEYYQNIENKNLSFNLCNYVWKNLITTTKGYSFNLSHTFSYSIIALQEMNLAYKYPMIYWDTACLLVNAGDEDNANYEKIAKAVCDLNSSGTNIVPININHSEFNFIPDEENNQIFYGFKGLTRVGDEIINQIITNRPYSSFGDFLNRTKVRKDSMISLIKSGAFDEFGERVEIMRQYLRTTADQKKELNLRNLAMLIKYNLLPQDELEEPLQVYHFNEYLKKQCKLDKEHYKLDDAALDFLSKINYNNYDENLILSQNQWKKEYDKRIKPCRDYIKTHHDELLNKLNDTLFQEEWDKYITKINYSAWEMESMCYYYHEHELANVDMEKYGFSDFFELPTEPEIDYSFPKGDKWIPIYELKKICGTCIAKDKLKGLIYLLTTSGVVTVRLRKEHMALFDKRIAARMPDGTKKIVEKSWFTRGTLLVCQGIRRGDEFVLKKYARTPTHQLYKITNVDENGNLELQGERYQGGEMEDED